MGHKPQFIPKNNGAHNATAKYTFFVEAIVIAAWEIWKISNDRVFSNGQVHVGIWFSNFKNQCLLQSLRFKDDLRSAFCFLLDAYS
jgi:hypothetical protein